ncbi:Crp/Fnr family transcriptional regulator [Tenacibaculum ovolyticum]|uniref:Crp/Fnr family transcriptional regulator n=1 Tax=Tenacibaculum ovolyticum TaxID=104270 RepID=UPI0022F3AB7B|nr:Crp/Fnr family transcriptional regulator [Tenacibaculum ovolyticum]WBX77439.1 Crp/Fnr family transcriptional regulator [Tenacibaculum ovolyticum]
MNNQLEKILPINKADELISIGQVKTISSTEYFIRKGETPKKLAFVISGLFRYVYIDKKGIEYTKGIITENNFITSYSAMISKSNSHFFIEALEDSKILEIPYLKWKNLIETDSFWLKFLLTLVEKGFSIKEKRERDLLLLNAEMRYKNFLKDFPLMEGRIKQAIIASYLGIQPESLSRVRKKMLT